MSDGLSADAAWGDLTEREQQIAKYLARGFSIRDTAEDLNANQLLIEVVVYRLYEKVGARSRASFLAWMATQVVGSPRLPTLLRPKVRMHTATPDEVEGVRKAFSAAGFDADISQSARRRQFMVRGIPWSFIVEVAVGPFLSFFTVAGGKVGRGAGQAVVSGAAEGGRRVRALVKSLYVARQKSPQKEGVIALSDPELRIQVVLEDDLLDQAYELLLTLDLSGWRQPPTKSEIKAGALAAQGVTTAEIATSLGLSRNTVNSDLARLFNKLMLVGEFRWDSETGQWRVQTAQPVRLTRRIREGLKRVLRR